MQLGHEDLIRFSNHLYYEDRLQVFPSPELDHAALGIRDVFVPDARYDAGATRTNRGEAERVVDLVFDLFRRIPTDETVGVIALSRAQADCIWAVLDERRRANPDAEERFKEDKLEPFFIKNLENVQGDERDHIILCIGYGPTVATGKAFNRFGPLNSDLGWRRLNVAVSRARRSMTVVHSLHPSDITAQTRGAVELKRFLEFVADPRAAFMARQTFDPDAETESIFEEAVKRALEARGHRVQPQVGVAGFRIDLAIYSEDGRRFDLGIECDGYTYHATPAARDRDWLRQSILEDLGWRIHRVWSTAWIRDPGREIQAIEEALARARTADPPPGKSQLRRNPSSATLNLPDPPSAASARPPAQKPVITSYPTQRDDLFEPYRKATVRRSRNWEELRYATLQELRPRIKEIVEIEGPVHREIVIERLRDAFGQGRAGKPSQDNVTRAIERMLGEGQIIEPERGFLTTADKEVRPRRPGDRVHRPIRHIASTEIDAGLLHVSGALGKMSKQELIRETRRQFGWDRTGSDISEAMAAALARLTERRTLAEDSEGYVWLSGPP